MSFRIGAEGTDMWPECKALGIAAISYKPLAEVDLSQHERGEPLEKWSLLKSAQKLSLEAVAYEMQEGDIIYVKQGPSIISRGEVQGAYKFESGLDLRDEKGMPWPHQVPVIWEPYFLAAKISLGAEMSTVKRLTPEDIEKLEKMFRVFDHAKHRKKVEIMVKEQAEIEAAEIEAEEQAEIDAKADMAAYKANAQKVGA